MISFKGRHHQQDMILQCVRWYVAYGLSYRDLEELMQERGYAVDHSMNRPQFARHLSVTQNDYKRGEHEQEAIPRRV
jgi:transposase-like protein